MAERDRPHIFLAGHVSSEPYTSYGGGGQGREIPRRERRPHGQSLRGQIDSATDEGRRRRAELPPETDIESTGFHLTFESFPGLELALESLENRSLRRPAELVAVRTLDSDEGPIQMATVFIPDEAVSKVIRKFEQYINEDTRGGQPKNRNMIDRISGIRLATLESLWTEPTMPFPRRDAEFWWEMWLRRDEGRELTRALRFIESVGALAQERKLGFPDRTVLVVRATAAQLAGSVDVLDDLAELRAARAPAEFFGTLPAAEQRAWIDDLVGRLTYAQEADAARVCVLDSGVRGNHPLLAPSIPPGATESVDPDWGTADDRGHGTEMAGLALFGRDLPTILASSEQHHVGHWIESVKILPPPPRHNDPDLYGAICAEAVARIEVSASSDRRCYSLAVTASPGEVIGDHAHGQPTSWSSAVDAIVMGRTFVQHDAGLDYLDFNEASRRRLIVVSAGNIERESWQREHLDRSDVEPIHDPAQSWNALTVGAYTELIDPGIDDWEAVAPSGELSPISCTSVPFSRQWAWKPELVMEGGNLAMSSSGELDTPDAMHLLTTHGQDASRLLTLSNGTSAATAQAARMAAQAWSAYPDLQPETVRALLVHSARWTPRMEGHFQGRGRTERESLLRRYGMGVPDLERAIRSAKNDLVLIAEDTIHPFAEGRMREMHIHALPWPLEELEAIGETPVTLRVTLSYFIEPNPSRRGWAGRFRYASHGLRFDVKLPTESTDDLRARLNREALAEEETRPTGSDASEWFFGPRTRNRGSLHCDLWQGTAAALAARGYIAVYPVTGWWRELKARDRSEIGVPYALIVSIEAPEVDVDLWTAIETRVATPIEIET